MRPASVCFTFTTTTFFLLCFVRHSLSQIVGCDGTNVDCPQKDTSDKGGVCGYYGKQSGIGIVPFTSNVTSDGPLTWTMTEGDQTPKDNPFSYRGFYIGSPPSLNFQDVTDFGACAMVLGGDITSNLQLPSGFNDYSNFGCSTVMGDQCAQVIAALVRDQLLNILTDTSYDPGVWPCLEVGRRLQNTSYPRSCAQALNAQKFSYEGAITLTNNTELATLMYQKQESCSVTTGGSNYNMALGPQQTFYDGPDTEAVKRFKNGTSAVLTLFYNEPWKNHTTSPVDFLNEPEVHLSCLRKVQTAEKQQFSGSTSLRTSLEGLSLLWLVLCSLLWMGAMV